MHKFYALIFGLLLAYPAHAALDDVKQYMPNARAVGAGTLSVVFWEVYDATLYAPNGQWQRSKPFALSIDYKRTIDGVDIADRTAEEIRKLGYNNEMKLAAWHSQMRELFPDVVPGSNITGVYAPSAATKFYQGSTHIGTIGDPEFGTWFFDIWLSANTPEPDLRAALIGQ